MKVDFNETTFANRQIYSRPKTLELERLLISLGIARDTNHATKILLYVCLVCTVTAMFFFYTILKEEPIDDKYKFDPAIHNVDDNYYDQIQ